MDTTDALSLTSPLLPESTPNETDFDLTQDDYDLSEALSLSLQPSQQPSQPQPPTNSSHPSSEAELDADADADLASALALSLVQLSSPQPPLPSTIKDSKYTPEEESELELAVALSLTETEYVEPSATDLLQVRKESVQDNTLVCFSDYFLYDTAIKASYKQHKVDLQKAFEHSRITANGKYFNSGGSPDIWSRIIKFITGRNRAALFSTCRYLARLNTKLLLKLGSPLLPLSDPFRIQTCSLRISKKNVKFNWNYLCPMENLEKISLEFTDIVKDLSQVMKFLDDDIIPKKMIKKFHILIYPSSQEIIDELINQIRENNYYLLTSCYTDYEMVPITLFGYEKLELELYIEIKMPKNKNSWVEKFIVIN
jgi:hypothetical protein